MEGEKNPQEELTKNLQAGSEQQEPEEGEGWQETQFTANPV